MSDTFNILSQATKIEEGAASPVESVMGSGLLFPLALMILFYFLLIRPQSKQRKALEAKVSAMKKGDKVVTNGGIHGMVQHKGDKTISLKIAEGVCITVEPSSISSVEGEEESPKGDSKKLKK